MGETSKYRAVILNLLYKFRGKDIPYNLDILDIGCGDDPITPTCAKLDLEKPYTKCDPRKLTYRGDARYVDQFVMDKFDVVYSSHLLEDFLRNETIKTLCKWTSLLLDGGILVLLLPDQQRYIKHCEMIDELPNEHHSIEDFSMEYILGCLNQIDNLVVLFSKEFFENNDYNFLIVAKKMIDNASSL